MDVILDSHVHFHAGFDQQVFFGSAAANLSAAGAAVRAAPGAARALLLTEAPGDEFFDTLATREGHRVGGEWEVRKTDEPCSLVVQRGDGDCLSLVAGRQIPTRENLEVLAIGCRARFPRGLSLPEAIAGAREAGAIPVIPWGFGKWWFSRGRLVEEVLLSAERPIFLGDNGGRALISWRPRLFGIAEKQGVFLLPGSDPLPLPGQDRKVGRYGLLLRGSWDPAHPATSVKQLLLELSAQPRTTGQRERLFRFIEAQVRMQLRNRTAWGRR